MVVDDYAIVEGDATTKSVTTYLELMSLGGIGCLRPDSTIFMLCGGFMDCRPAGLVFSLLPILRSEEAEPLSRVEAMLNRS